MDYKQALQLDEQNGNSKWYDATKLEMDQINEYKVFQDHGKAQYDPKSRQVSNAPNGYQKIRVHLIFAVKHNGRHKARLVAGGHLTPDPIESIYSGVVSIRSLSERIPSTNPGAEPPRNAWDSGSARSHSMHLETSSSDRL